jgi:glycosyltransferase involved in cell wall biosynthesis
MSPRPHLLFLSPITPSTGGNGLAMRAGAFLEALARDFDVYLLIVPIAEDAPADLPPELAALCRAVERVPLAVPATLFARACHHSLLYPVLGRLRPYPTEWKTTVAATLRAALHAFAPVRFDHIHVFRLYLYPFAEPYAQLAHNRAARLHLDLDEPESATRQRLAALRPAARSARRLRRDAALYRGLEHAMLPACDRIYVCAPADADALRSEFGADRVALLPNTVRLPAVAAPWREAPDPFTFLFIGNLNYLPNRDALYWFADEVLPELRRAAPGAFRIRIVGSGRPRELRRLRRIPEFVLAGYLASIAAAYAGCEAVIAPLRAGGGTRIKILEALAWGRPVVSTTAGAAGLDLAHGAEVLLTDDAAGFAGACARLMSDPALRRALGARGRDAVQACYSQDALSCRLRGLGVGYRVP